ncbi:MAG TPA: ATP-grasp domain-containing protein [Vicinamibacteria bacterium]
MELKVLVTDGGERAALAVTRSLGRRGVSVVVGAEEPLSLAGASRHCARTVVYPSPDREPEAFRRFLRELVRRREVDAVIPVTDVTTFAVCRDEHVLARDVAVAVPPLEAFEQVTDKACLVESARGCGIAVPRTHVLDGAAGLDALAPGLQYPVVVKAARSRVPTAEGWLPTSVHYARDEAELRRLYERTPYLAAHRSLLQSRVVGPGTGLFALFDRGELVASFAHRRLREKPPSGGVSVLCESVPVEPPLREDARRLLGPLGWHGVAMLEYKRDGPAGTPNLIEVNGRFWGSLQLAVEAGVDFPWLLLQLALGWRLDAPRGFRTGVRNRWLLGDLDHLLLRLRPGRDAAAPAGAPSRAGAVRAFVRDTRPDVSDQVWSREDPRPFVLELRRYLRAAAAPAGRRLRLRWRALVGYPARHAVERARRDPRDVVAALRSARRILVLCHGNIVRSPFAARLLAQALGDACGVSVASAGIAASAGTAAPTAALAAAAARGVDLRPHAAAPLTDEAVAGSDAILVMDLPQLRHVRRRYPQARRRVFLLSSLAPATDLEVRDPFGREEPAFHACYDHIAAAVTSIAHRLGREARP